MIEVKDDLRGSLLQQVVVQSAQKPFAIEIIKARQLFYAARLRMMGATKVLFKVDAFNPFGRAGRDLVAIGIKENNLRGGWIFWLLAKMYAAHFTKGGQLIA